MGIAGQKGETYIQEAEERKGVESWERQEGKTSVEVERTLGAVDIAALVGLDSVVSVGLGIAEGGLAWRGVAIASEWVWLRHLADHQSWERWEAAHSCLK